jgi:sugar lactone lactonase YvrE
MQRIIVKDDYSLLYFTEDGNKFVGIHARDRQGQLYTILEGPAFYGDETTGLAFSPDGMHMYFAFQDAGQLFDITRADGLRFDAKTLNIKYHNLNGQ